MTGHRERMAGPRRPVRLFDYACQPASPRVTPAGNPSAGYGGRSVEALCLPASTSARFSSHVSARHLCVAAIVCPARSPAMTAPEFPRPHPYRAAGDASSEQASAIDPRAFIATLTRIGKGAAADGQPWPERHQMPGRRMALGTGGPAHSAGNAAGGRARPPERTGRRIRGRSGDGRFDDGVPGADRAGQRADAARGVTPENLPALPPITRRNRLLPSASPRPPAARARSARAALRSAHPATTRCSGR